MSSNNILSCFFQGKTRKILHLYRFYFPIFHAQNTQPNKNNLGWCFVSCQQNHQTALKSVKSVNSVISTRTQKSHSQFLSRFLPYDIFGWQEDETLFYGLNSRLRVTMEPRYNEGSRGLAKCVRGHNEVLVYRDFFPQISLLLDRRISFVTPKTS